MKNEKLAKNKIPEITIQIGNEPKFVIPENATLFKQATEKPLVQREVGRFRIEKLEKRLNTETGK